MSQAQLNRLSEMYGKTLQRSSGLSKEEQKLISSTFALEELGKMILRERSEGKCFSLLQQ